MESCVASNDSLFMFIKISNFLYLSFTSAKKSKNITKESVRKFIQGLKIPKEDKDRLLKLTPQTYIGLADKI